ncbi:FmdB family zinc ribbon protein [Tundrisphaera lichenicola]|uniref:FmdB family zinc ribbon protein n=1 Tax=Tundrisphaera lichenicola TaxID=2029860 RepID=UPI003EBB5E20
MPMYEYRCESCDHEFEALVRSSSDVPKCPRCKGTELLKAFSVPAAARANAGQGMSLPMAPPSGGCGAGGCGSGMCGMG